MKIPTTAREDYLKALLVLEKRLGNVHSVDVARYLGISRPSVCHAVSNLSKKGFLKMSKDFHLHLTKEGREIAEKTYERHRFFTDRLVAIGVDLETAEEDACRLEHAISDKSFELLKARFEEKSTTKAPEHQEEPSGDCPESR